MLSTGKQHPYTPVLEPGQYISHLSTVWFKLKSAIKYSLPHLQCSVMEKCGIMVSGKPNLHPGLTAYSLCDLRKII